MIDIDDLKAFITILSTGSISRAAEDLGLTQPALSLKLKRMEQELGVQLFQRTSRNVMPLESAMQIEAKVRELLSKFDVLKETLAAGIAELKGTVRIGVLSGWFDVLMVQTVEKCLQKAPQIQLKLHAGQTLELVPMVLRGQLDMAIVAQPFENNSDLSSQHLLDEELVLVGAHLPNFSDEKKQREALLQRSWVTMHVPDPLVDKYWREEFGESFPWNSVKVPTTIDHIHSIPLFLASIPDSIAVLPKQIMHRGLPRSVRTELQVSEAVPQRNGLFLIWRTGGLELKKQQLVQQLVMEQVQWYAKQHRGS